MKQHDPRGSLRRRAAPALLALAAACPGAALAEAAAPQQPPPAVSVPLLPPAGHQAAVAGERNGYLFDLRSDDHSFRDAMGRYGLSLHGFYQQAVMDVVQGGHEHTSNYLGLGYFGGALDTGKAFGIDGGTIDMTASVQLGNTVGAGQSTASQTEVPWGFGDHVRLVTFYWDQAFLHDAVHFTAGRMNQLSNLPGLSPGFHIMPWLCTFWSNSCGTPHAYNFNAGHPGYQVGSWGGVITVHPAPFWYLKAGVIENEPVENATRSHAGWPGRDWGLDKADGAFLPAQIGYVTTPASSLYPTNVHLGGYFDTAIYADKYYSVLGLPIAQSHGAPAQMHHSASGMFAGLQQTVLRFSSDPKSVRGLALIASADWELSGYGADKQQYEAGFLMTGPFASRAADQVNFLATFQIFDPRQKLARRGAAAAHGLAYSMGDQTALELNYGFAVAPGFLFYPYVQYVMHPDQLALAVPDPNDRHATVVGFRTVMRFDQMF
jgi:porin